jgi:hypothetical protein
MQINFNIQGGYVLFYQPPCGKWYVHSHKIYGSVQDAFTAAEKFLSSGTPISIIAIGEQALETSKGFVP